MTKHHIRQLIKQTHSLYTRQYKQEASARIVSFLRDVVPFQSGMTVWVYTPISNEPDITPYIAACWEQGIETVFPCHHKTVWLFVRSPSMVPWNNHTLETDYPHTQHHLDYMLVPCVACTQNGWRVWRWSWWYDRAIARHKETNPALSTLCVCYSRQILDNVPVDSHDRPVDIILTEQWILQCRDYFVE